MRARPAPQTLDRTARFSQVEASSVSGSYKQKRFRERLGRSGYGQSVAKAAIVELVILAKQYREIELNSPTTQSRVTSHLRVDQFNLRLNLVLPVDEYLLPSVVNLSFVAIAFSRIFEADRPG
jgi:hypothetical protein